MDHGTFGAFDIAASGLAAQRRRLDAVAENIANAQTTRTAEGGPYKRREVTLSSQEGTPPFRHLAPTRIRLARTAEDHIAEPRFEPNVQPATSPGVLAEETRVDSVRLVYDPGHPDANENGMVAYPDISIVQEMIEMILASRAYEANVTAIQAAKAMVKSALEI